MTAQCDIGLIGLAVMGQNLVLNMADHGFTVAAYNRTTSRVDDFIAGPAQGKAVVGCHGLEAFVQSLKKPRIAMLMVKAGDPVKQTIKQLAPLLEPGDIIIDGGNSCFLDTEEQIKNLEPSGILYMGTGISGGEEGARHGPSIMPGGVKEAWFHVRPIFQAIAAKVGPDKDIPCCDWVGSGGAGHYVKMVHNGIEYGDMQLICEAYSLLKDGLGLNNDELYDVFSEWNRGELDSYLIEITRDIFSVTDDKTGKALVDMILDKAGQKGTGKWTAQHALDLGVPTTLITEAVFARTLSALKENRVRASKILTGPIGALKEFRSSVNKEDFVNQARKALFASKICSYAQGFFQLQAAAEEYGWELDYGGIAMLWRGGCIIRAAFLEDIKKAYDRDPQLENLLLDKHFTESVVANQAAWRQVVCTAAELGIPIPAMSAALNYYDSYRSERLPHNLLQAQRDYFGSHTYERVDEEGSFHTDWARERRKTEK
ncbi:MAG: 6-phosphogluconate dehydrogenase [Desulfobacterales bacterium SG8_35]|nr:MAG: 6-phosphogluconate dehydrogenase [Desulfobacterales bacterium SG8_35]